MDPNEIRQIIESGIDTVEVQVTGDGRHFDAIVVASAFEGKNRLKQHRLVYETLGDRFDKDVVHALSIKTFTPAQWADRNS